MGLKELVIHNFKSYDGTFTIPFDGTPFVAIVGPNGSGKSNLLDAICFVVGMNSSKLRGSDSAELVHNNSRTKDMFVSAQVTSDANKDKITTFKRTLSSYFVDDELVNESEYKSIWASVRVIPDARNCVVLQGDIERLAGEDSISLATLIENLRGSIDLTALEKSRVEFEALKSEIEEASKVTRKHAMTRRAAQAIADEVNEVSLAREKLQDLKSEIKSLEHRRKRLILTEKRALLANLKHRSEEALRQLETTRAEAELVDSDSRKLRTEYAKKRRQLLNARSAEVDAQESLTAAEAECAPLVKKQESIETEQRIHEPDFRYATEALDTLEKDVQSAKEAVKSIDRAHDKEKAKETANDPSGSFTKASESWTRLQNEHMTETALGQDELDRLSRQVSHAKQYVSNKDQQLEDLRAELKRAEGRIRQRTLRLQQLNSLVNERSAQQEQRKSELEETSESLLVLRAEQRELTAKLKEINEKVRTTDGNKRALAQRRHLLDAVERLRRMHPGKVHDLLGNLLEASESSFSVAIERAMGSNADSIVVDDAETAIDCVAQAKREKMGTLSFLPLSDLRNRDIVAARAQLARQSLSDKQCRLLLDCAKFDSVFRPAVVYALGDSIFVNTFADGLELRRAGLKMRIIDTKGSILSTNNIVSASPGESSSVSASDRAFASLQRKAQVLAEKLKSNNFRETELRDKEIRLNAQLDRAAQTIEGAQTEARVAAQYLHAAEVETENLKSVHEAEQNTLKELQSRFEEAETNLTAYSAEINKIREIKFAKFIEEFGGSLSEWDARFMGGSQRHAESSRQRRRLEDRLHLASERRDMAKVQLQRQKQRADFLKAALKRVTRQRAKLEAEQVTAKQKLERAQARVRVLREETETKSDEVGNAENALEDAEARVAEAEREEHRHALALAAEIGQSQAELDAEIDSEGSADDSLNGNSASTKSVRNTKKRRAPGGSPGRKNTDRETLSIDRLDARIKSLRDEMEPLIPLVSFHGSDADGEQSLKELDKSVKLDQTAQNSRANLEKLTSQLAEIRTRRKRKFDEILEQLQAILSAVYAELAGEDAQAKLTPVNANEPFEQVEFMVMPPGKPFTTVSQLSGGERSMAALALLFSCQRLHPAPFVVLDEVDAALDFSNVASVSRYIRSHCSETQFVFVSLKQRLFQTASHLLGVYKEKRKSQILTVPLQVP